MRGLGRRLAAVVLGLVAVCALAAEWVAPWPYERQFREETNAAPSRRFPLGTDELGRDRFSRLVYGTRVSLLVAPAAAGLTVGLALLAGLLSVLGGRRTDGVLRAAGDLTLGLPWLFLLLIVRGLLPLDTAPAVSVGITFAMLGVLGWAGPARVVRRGMLEALESESVVAARSRGVGWSGIAARYLAPRLRPVLAAQFWTVAPAYVLAEANLGMLGLGVSEPLPSWGALLRELEGQVGGWNGPLERVWLLAPVALLVIVVLGMRVVFPGEVAK